MIKIKVISQKGTCAIGHKIGDEITVTENGIEGKICIHALYSIMPKVFAMLYDAEFPWLEDSSIATHACPDGENPVIFEVKKVK